MTEWPLRWLMLPMLLAMATWAWALDAPPVRIESRSAINDLLPQSAATVTHVLALSVANIDAWPDAEMIGAVRHSAQILAQCGIGIVRADLLQVATPESHRHFDSPRSRELARMLALPKPTLYFAAGTRQIPAFDAEAIGRGNSCSRPELADTVWIARGARDLGIVIAHELAHVLMDSGAHDNTPGNLMAETTTPRNTQLTGTQCARIRGTGERNGLLQRRVN
jgi:hypothetical protein